MEQEPKTEAKKVEGFELRDGRFPEVLTYAGHTYDVREVLPDGDGWYRMTNEARITIDGPNYVQVNKKGEVVREMN